VFVLTFASTPWAIMLLLGDLTFGFTLGPQKAFMPSTIFIKPWQKIEMSLDKQFFEPKALVHVRRPTSW
jgi:hypothetical protein